MTDLPIHNGFTYEPVTTINGDVAGADELIHPVTGGAWRSTMMAADGDAPVHTAAAHPYNPETDTDDPEVIEQGFRHVRSLFKSGEIVVCNGEDISSGSTRTPRALAKTTEHPNVGKGHCSEIQEVLHREQE